MRRRRVLALAICLGVILLAGFGLLAALAPFARSRVVARAARYGAYVDVERTRIGYKRVSLDGVHVRFAAAPGLTIALQHVDVDLTWGGALHAIEAKGGCFFASGSIDELRAQARALRDLAPHGNSESSGQHTPLALRDVCVRWSSGAAENVVMAADGVSVERARGEWLVGARSAGALKKTRSIHLADARATLRRRGEQMVLSEMRIGEAYIENNRETAEADGEQVDGLNDGTVGIVERARGLEKKIRRGAELFETVTDENASIEIASSHVSWGYSGGVLTIGPAHVGLTRSAEGVRMVVSSAATEGSTPIGVALNVPASKQDPIDARVSGGPISLSALGLRDGDMGLANVGATTVDATGAMRITPGVGRVLFDGEGRVRNVSMHRQAVASAVVRGASLGVSAKGEVAVDGSFFSLERAELDIGGVRAQLAGQMTRSMEGGSKIHATWAVPLASCQGLLDALPEGFAPKLAGMRMSGAFSVHGGVRIDSAEPSGDAADFKLLDECRVTATPADIDVARFRRPFERMVYAPDGKREKILSGPGTADWVPLSLISPYMTAAVLTSEDGGFRHHRGFDGEAIRSSIRDDLRAGRFLRGASTISMQTAKNLYLEREKTLARKLQEAVLTHYLEEALTKEEILELYLNSIEFGPMIYGIGPAAAYYFHTTPMDLSLGQCFFLASILPSPKAQHFSADGRMHAQWMGYLRTLMRISAKHHLVDDAELREGLSEWVTFGQAHPPQSSFVDDGISGPGPGWDRDGP